LSLHLKVQQDFFLEVIQKVETKLSGSHDKVDISRILMQRVDGLSSTARVSSLEAANAVLAGWANGALVVGHDQCDVQIVFEDGFRYHGHYQLKKSEKRVSLSRHIRQQLIALAKTSDATKSSSLPDEPVISQIGATPAESAKIALEHYNI
jgi:hypothetical protein